MDRRTFLKTTAGVGAAALAAMDATATWAAGATAAGGRHAMLARTSPAQTSPQSRRISLIVNPEQALGEIPADFLGLGYEISSVARPGLLSARNSTYVQFVRNLGRHGVIRIGGNTSDFSSFSKDGPAVCATKGTVADDAVIHDLGEFLEATGWQLIWGLNLGSRDVRNAVDEAASVIAAAKEKLLAFEIGNEPDLFAGGVAHRAKGYSYADYLKEYREYKAALRAKFPKIPFAGPDVASHTDWVTQFAADEGSDVKLLTHHRYAEGPPTSPASTIERLLAPSEGLTRMLTQCEAASHSAGVPYRICETNSCFGGGKPGVSDTLAAALWGLDYLFTMAAANCAGANLETGINQLGFVSSYSPIADDEAQRPVAKPLYYAMLAFAKAGRGTRIGTQFDPAGTNVTAYAVKDTAGRIVVTAINKTADADTAMSISLPEHFKKASILRLTGPSLESKTGVALGGAEAGPEGKLPAEKEESIAIHNGSCDLPLPAASAAILTAEG